MQTTKKIYRVKRDMSEDNEIISIKTEDKTENIPVEKLMSKILHNIIMKEADTKDHENAE